MVDFTATDENLAQTFAIKKELPSIEITPLKEKDKRKPESSLAPQIPEFKFDATLPENVKESMNETQAVQAANRAAQRQRNMGLVSDAQKTTNILNDADQKIETSRNHFFGEILGLFDDDYDVSEQNRRKQEAVRNYQTKVQMNKLTASSEKLNEEDAAADFTNYIQTQKLKGQKIGFKLLN